MYKKIWPYNLFLILLLLIQNNIDSKEIEIRENPYYKGLETDFLISCVKDIDVDGDGTKEIGVCYREREDKVDRSGGIMFAKKTKRGWISVYNCFFSGYFPVDLQESSKGLEITFKKTTYLGDEKYTGYMTYGKDFYFRDSPESLYSRARITASSILENGGKVFGPENMLDGDIKTAWAEGDMGTGVNESFTLQFDKPVSIAYIGVLNGNTETIETFKENNRVYQAEIETEGQSDRFDKDSNVDIMQDLGVDMLGLSIDVSFPNKPYFKYIEVMKDDLIRLKLTIRSTYVGTKTSDTYISELDIVELKDPTKFIKGKKE